jgi:hypothetical protein
MVGTTRFELATSPTPILETTQSESLSETHQYVSERKTIRSNPYWTRNGPIDGPTLVYATQTRHERQPAMSLRDTNGYCWKSPRDALWQELLRPRSDEHALTMEWIPGRDWMRSDIASYE